MTKYLFDRTIADQTNSSNFPSIMHHTVKRLIVCEQPEDSESNEKQRYEYTQTLCHLAASAIEWSFRDQWTLVEHLKPHAIAEDGDGADLQDVSRHTLAAAAYLEKNGLVTQLLSNENIDLRGEIYFGRFFECAAKSGNNDILSRFLSSSDIEFYNSLYFTPLSPAASAGHSSTVSLLLSPQYDIITKGAPYEKAIESAAGNSHTDIVIYLLDHSTEEASKKQELVH